MKRNIVTAGITLIALLVVGVPAYAQNDPGATTPQKAEREKSQNSGQRTQTTEPKTNPTQTTQEPPATTTEKRNTLDATRRKACQERKIAIARIFTNATNKGETALLRLMNIQARLEDFYASKHLSSADYTALVTAASAARTKAKAALGNIKEVNFTCDSANPEAAGRTFQAGSKALTSALQEYRNTLKKLITAIRIAAKDKES